MGDWPLRKDYEMYPGRVDAKYPYEDDNVSIVGEWPLEKKPWPVERHYLE